MNRSVRGGKVSGLDTALYKNPTFFTVHTYIMIYTVNLLCIQSLEYHKTLSLKYICKK